MYGYYGTRWGNFGVLDLLGYQLTYPLPLILYCMTFQLIIQDRLARGQMQCIILNMIASESYTYLTSQSHIICILIKMHG